LNDFYDSCYEGNDFLSADCGFLNDFCDNSHDDLNDLKGNGFRIDLNDDSYDEGNDFLSADCGFLNDFYDSCYEGNDFLSADCGFLNDFCDNSHDDLNDLNDEWKGNGFRIDLNDDSCDGLHFFPYFCFYYESADTWIL
jgi:hypothetical protein